MFGLSFNFWDKLRLPRKLTRDLLWGLFLGITLSVSSTTLGLIAQEWRRKRTLSRIPPRPIEIRSEEVVDGVIGLIGMFHAWLAAFDACIGLRVGNTPLLRINSLSDALGVEILVRHDIAGCTNSRAKPRFVTGLNLTELMPVSESGRIGQRPCCAQKCVWSTRCSS
jgi:hypothetical protein